MVDRKSVPELLFLLKFNCDRSQALAHTYFSHFKYYCIILISFTEAILVCIMTCFDGYYRNLFGIIGLFKYAIKAFIH